MLRRALGKLPTALVRLFAVSILVVSSSERNVQCETASSMWGSCDVNNIRRLCFPLCCRDDRSAQLLITRASVCHYLLLIRLRGTGISGAPTVREALFGQTMEPSTAVAMSHWISNDKEVALESFCTTTFERGLTMKERIPSLPSLLNSLGLEFVR